MARPPKKFVYERAVYTTRQHRSRVLWTAIVMFLVGVGSTLFALQHYGFIDIVRRG
jgi:hypothetical protein